VEGPGYIFFTAAAELWAVEHGDIGWFGHSDSSSALSQVKVGVGALYEQMWREQIIVEPRQHGQRSVEDWLVFEVPAGISNFYIQDLTYVRVQVVKSSYSVCNVTPDRDYAVAGSATTWRAVFSTEMLEEPFPEPPTPPDFSIPEPSTVIIWSLLGALGSGVGWWRKRRGA